MRFKDALRDNSDPLYAPCIGKTRNDIFWKAPRKYRDLGFEPRSVKIGKVGDDPLAIAREARRLTIAMVDRYKVEEYPAGTWAWLISRYERDEYSPFQKVKSNTRQTYQHCMDRWKKAIGPLKIGALTFEEICKIELAMKQKGRTASNIKRMMTMLRILAGYGKALRNPEARDVSDTLSEMTFASAPRRSVHPTRDQIRAIIDEADARGLFAFATGLLLQWTFLLRSVDVRGQWLPTDGKEGGIVRDGERWQDGLTWDMFDADLTRFEKVISKTARSNPEPLTFHLTPELRSRLCLLSNDNKIGPVIVSERYGEPYSRYSWAQTFRRIRTHLNLPADIKIMDTRAGGITEASQMGADPLAIRDAAGHSNLSTTDKYLRGRSESAAKVVQLRNVK